MPIELELGKKQQKITPAQHAERKRTRRFWVTAATVLTILAFVLVLRLYAFEFSVVTSGSMEKTLFKGDFMVVNHRLALRRHWNRGDVVLFHTPPDWEGGGEAEGDSGVVSGFKGQTLVKRIIGLPGETISMRGGVVSINGKVLDQNYLPEAPDSEGMLPKRLGDDEYWVMGDNRNHSDDSRNNGPVPEKYIIGRVVFKYWPPKHMGALPATNYGPLATDN